MKFTEMGKAQDERIELLNTTTVQVLASSYCAHWAYDACKRTKECILVY